MMRGATAGIIRVVKVYRAPTRILI
jgi:hypothetical protein